MGRLCVWGGILGGFLCLTFAAMAGPIVEKKFNHAEHELLKKSIASACSNCHTSDSKGKRDMPGKLGHQPCLAVGCHASDFVSVSERMKGLDLARYKKASAFCFGCHVNTGTPPAPSTKASAKALYKGNERPGHYLEMNHLDHVALTKCSTCHVVDTESHQLSVTPPGHAQCASCHGEHDSLEMDRCQGCHKNGEPSSYYQPRTFKSDVRSCGSERYSLLATKSRQGKKPPCFKHETRAHRLRRNGSVLECKACHFMFQQESYDGHKYSTLKEVKRAPVIENRRGKAHKSCGSYGCHRRDVDDGMGTGKCRLCHSSDKSTIESTLSD